MSSIVKEQIQQLAHSKTGVVVGAGGVTAKTWVDWVVNSPEAQAAIIVVGFLLSISIIVVNVQTFLQRRDKD